MILLMPQPDFRVPSQIPAEIRDGKPHGELGQRARQPHAALAIHSSLLRDSPNLLSMGFAIQ